MDLEVGHRVLVADGARGTKEPLDGGEAVKLTSVKGGVGDYAWSPDAKKLALVMTDLDPDEADTTKKDGPKPIVVDRYRFKVDIWADNEAGEKKTVGWVEVDVGV